MCGSIIPACNLSWVWNPSEENHIKKLISIVLWIDDGMSGRRRCRLKKMRLIPMCVMCRYVQLHSFYLIGQWRPALKHIQNIILPEQFISIHRGGNWGPVLFQLNHNDCDKDPSSAWYENFCAEPDLSRRPVFSSRAHKKETSLCAPHRTGDDDKWRATYQPVTCFLFRVVLVVAVSATPMPLFLLLARDMNESTVTAVAGEVR